MTQLLKYWDALTTWVEVDRKPEMSKMLQKMNGLRWSRGGNLLIKSLEMINRANVVMFLTGAKEEKED